MFPLLEQTTSTNKEMPHANTVNRSVVRTKQAPAAIGPYSQGILVEPTLFCSGQIALEPKSACLISGGITEETEQVLENISAILGAAGMDFAHIVQCRVYLTSMDDFAQFNDVYARYFSNAPPARETIQVSGLPRGARVEISCTAVR